MLLDLTHVMRGLASNEPLPFQDRDDDGKERRRDMTLRDGLLQILETDTGPERTQAGTAQGPSKLQAFSIGRDIMKASDEIELSKNDGDSLRQIVQRSRGMAIITGQVEALLDEAERDWQAAKAARKEGKSDKDA